MKISNTPIVYTLIALAVLCMLIGMLSCNPTKRATRHIQKAERLDPLILAEICSNRYPPVDSVFEKVVYKQGKIIHDTTHEIDYYTINDTIVKKVVEYRTRIRIDTVERLKEVAKSDKAIVKQLNECKTATAVIEAYTKRLKKQRNYMMYGIAAFLILYFILKWIKGIFPTSWIAKIFKILG